MSALLFVFVCECFFCYLQTDKVKQKMLKNITTRKILQNVEAFMIK